jgi:parallel beta-helix repeat protein
MGAKTAVSVLCLVGLLGAAASSASATQRSLGARSSDTDADGCTLRIAAGRNLQHALDRIPEGDKPATLCLGAGEFRLPGFLSIARDGVRLRGEGHSTVLRLADHSQSPIIVIGDYRHQIPGRAVSSVAIEHLRIIGGGGGGSEVQRDHPYLTNSALVIRSGRDIAVRDLDVSACRSACILTEHDTRDVAIERTTISGSTWDGISLNRTSRARLVGNTIRDNTAAGITTEHLEDSVIERNTIDNNRSQGVYLSDSYRNRFVRNRFSGNTNAGVFLTCAVRSRDPGSVRCWDDSMSQANTFERNVFVANRLGYIVAPDAAANCAKTGVVPNVSRGDQFLQNPSIEQPPATHGRWLERAGPSEKHPRMDRHRP